MKKLLLAALLVLGMAMSASAAVKSFKSFSIDVPDGWTATEDGSVVALIAPGNACALSIASDSAGGMKGEDVAKAMSQQLKGTAPQAQDGGYAFTFKNQNGVESKCFVMVEDNKFVMLTITGDHPQLGQILDSIEDK